MPQLAERMGIERKWRALVAGGDRSTMDATVRLLGGSADMTVIGAVTHGQDALATVADYRPDLVLLDQGLARPSALETARQILQLVPGTWVFITAAGASVELWQEAKAAGVRAVLATPLTHDNLAEAVALARETDQRHISHAVLSHGSPQTLFYGSGSARTLRQEIIALFSPKGGVGKTTLAVNLGVLYAMQRTGLRVAVVDFDLGTASVGVELGFPERPDRTLLDWVGVEGATLDRSSVEALMVQHASGLWVLPAPGAAVDRLQIAPEVFDGVIAAMRRCFDIVIYDLPTSGYDKDYVLHVLTQATAVLLVVTPDTSCITAMHEVEPLLQSELMSQLGFDPNTVRIVVNRRPKQGGHSIADILQVAHFPAVGMPIPEEPRVRRHSNIEEHGRAAIESLQGTPWSLSLRSVARAIVPLSELREGRAERRGAEHAAGQPGFFRRLLGGGRT